MTLRAVKLSLPPIVLLGSYCIAYIAANAESAAFTRIHFPLEFIIPITAIASVVLAIRLFPDRSNPSLRVPFILNTIVTVLVVLGLAITLLSNLIW